MKAPIVFFRTPTFSASDGIPEEGADSDEDSDDDDGEDGIVPLYNSYNMFFLFLIYLLLCLSRTGIRLAGDENNS